MEKLTVTALQAVALTMPQGFTIDAHTLAPVTAGYAVAVEATQNSFGADGAARVLAYISQHEEVNAVGGWYNSENGQYYYDATIIVDDIDEATELGKANRQIAIYDLKKNQEIRL